MGVKLLFASIAMTVALALGFAVQARAIDVFPNGCGTAEQCAIAKEDKLQTGSGNIVWNIVSAILMILGGVSVIMIIVGGLRFVMSGGDSSAVKSAKNTVFYAIIGLVVALLAGTLVLFVTNLFA